MTKIEKKLLRALAGEQQKVPPVWLMRQAGRYLPEYRKLREREKNFLAFCYNPQLSVEAALQPLRRFDLDGAILFSDILVIPDALGQVVGFVEGEGPRLEPLRSVEEIEKLTPQNLAEHLAPVYEAMEMLKGELSDDMALIGFAGAPWTVATYMIEGGASRDYRNIRGWAYRRPEEFKKLIDLLIGVTVEYLAGQVERGAEAVQLFDSWAGILPPAQFHQWSIEPIKEITRRLKQKYAALPVIGFPRGAGLLYDEFATETKVDCVSIDANLAPSWARDNLQNKCCVQGNLDNLLLIEGGSLMDREIDEILQVLGGGPFIFNLGHGILPETPLENVGRLVDRVKASGAS